MIVKEIIIINSIQYERTYSDSGMIIERDGVQYGEAIDPLNSCREYVETDMPIDENLDNVSGDEFLSMLEEVL